MELRPGYKQTEVGVIPEEWEVKKVGDVCGFIVPGRNRPKCFDGNIPWITTPDLEDGRSVSKSRIGLSISRDEAKNVGSKIVPPGSVLMSCAGELGIVAFTENEIVINQQLHAFIPSPIIDGLFLLNAIKGQKRQIDGLATKTAVPYLNKDNCNSILIPLPPLPERAIAEALADTDALIGALENLIAKKRDLKQAAMQQLLTNQTRLPGFSGEWESKRLGDIVDINKGELITEKTAVPGSIPVIAGGKAPAYFHDRANRLGKTITISGSGASAGFVAYHSSPIFASDCSTISEGASYSVEFVHCTLLLNQNIIYKAQTGGAQPHVHPSDLFPIAIAYPPTVAEQTAIASVLSDMDAEIEALAQRLAKTRALKQGMMQELLTGRTRLI